MHVTKNTKDGRYREVPVIGNVEAVEAACKAAGDKKVLETFTGGLKAPNGADTHLYRSDYATALYKTLARPIEDVPDGERYYCRTDRAGIVYDRKAMERVSQALGHTRVTVIAQSSLIPTGKPVGLHSDMQPMVSSLSTRMYYVHAE